MGVNQKENRYYCKKCGSTNIKVEAWVNPNATNEVELSANPDKLCFCKDCGSTTQYSDLDERIHDIVTSIEGLVHKRFNINTLNKEVSKIIGEEVKLELGRLDITDEPDWCYQWNSEVGDIFAYYDIYVLRHRNVDWNGNDLYVTEVGFEFHT